MLTKDILKRLEKKEPKRIVPVCLIFNILFIINNKLKDARLIVNFSIDYIKICTMCRENTLKKEFFKWANIFLHLVAILSPLFICWGGYKLRIQNDVFISFVNTILYIYFFAFVLLFLFYAISSAFLSSIFLVPMLFFYIKEEINIILAAIDTVGLSIINGELSRHGILAVIIVIYTLVCDENVGKIVNEILLSFSSLAFTILSFITSLINEKNAKDAVLKFTGDMFIDFLNITDSGYEIKTVFQIIPIVFLPTIGVCSICILMINIRRYLIEKYPNKFYMK